MKLLLIIAALMISSCSTDGYVTSHYVEETKCCNCTEKKESKFNHIKYPRTRVYLECMDRWQEQKHHDAARICKVYLE